MALENLSPIDVLRGHIVDSPLGPKLKHLTIVLKGKKYSPFRRKASFRDWLDLFIELFNHQGDSDAEFADILFRLIDAEDVGYLKKKQHFCQYYNFNNKCFEAGLFDLVCDFENGGVGTQSVYDRTWKISIPGDEQPALLYQAGALILSPNRKLELCKKYQALGLIGTSPPMLKMYQEIEDLCRVLRNNPTSIPPTITIMGEKGTERERVKNIISSAQTERHEDLIKVIDPDANYASEPYIFVPPLCDRREDIPLLVKHYLTKKFPENNLYDLRFPITVWLHNLFEPRHLHMQPENLEVLLFGLITDSDPLESTREISYRQSNIRGEVFGIDYIFQRNGDFFTIEFLGRRVELRNAKGLRYIAYLLAHPGQSFHVFDLRNIIDGVEPTAEHPYRKMDSAGLAEDNLVAEDGYSFDDTLDKGAGIQYKAKLRKLAADRAQAEGEGDAIVLKEIDIEVAEIRGQLNKDVYKGKGRRIAPQLAKDNKAVWINIIRAKKKIKSLHEPLWHHIDEHIELNSYHYCYNPLDSSIMWQV